MPFGTQLALSLELAQIFPIRETLNIGVKQLENLIRALKRNGSDFLVEEDLANVFGRGKIEPSLEKDFRDVVRIGSFQPLHADSAISLDAGPGATVRRALKDRFYMSSVIQLSFLAWMHEETTLAAVLVENMLWRYESKVQGATPDPDYDGILKTLQACSSQTSQYRWDNLVNLVEERFQNSIQSFRTEASPLRHLSPNLLLGAMDYFYMTQSLPEDRFVSVENQTGLVPIVIWAHYILGLTVLIKNSPDGDVAFGSFGSPQVIIQWSNTLSLPGGGTAWPGFARSYGKWESAPTIYLLDAEMQVLLQAEPNDNAGTRIEGQECHRLRGYGTSFLQRLFNTKTLVADDDPIYVETANLAVSFAILLSRVMRRVSLPQPPHPPNVPHYCYIKTEHWRLFDASNLLLWGIALDKRKIGEYLESLSGKSIEDMPIPTSARNYLQKLSGKDIFFQEIKQLASWIISFAQVVNIGSCADLPLRAAPGWMFCTGVLNWNGLDPINIEADVWFNLIMKMMRKDTTAGVSFVDSEGIFLTCHQGWSLFYSSIGDCDPGEIDCELLCIKQGVPTNTRTGERKYRIADAPTVEQSDWTPKVFERQDSYLPRCVTKVYERKEHYSSRTDEFRLSIRFDIEELDFHSRTPIQQKLFGGLSRQYPAPTGRRIVDPYH
ncbi:MAG: hypothetical protein LQ338_000128 [Usnochroma carphineum]|nr:MAG: hypothetical protein LQ338_000128 [Usnochroma carphineum]